MLWFLLHDQEEDMKKWNKVPTLIWKHTYTNSKEDHC